MTNWRYVVIRMLSVMLFAFGCSQMYEMSNDLQEPNYLMMLYHSIGGGLCMFAALSMFGLESE